MKHFEQSLINAESAYEITESFFETARRLIGISSANMVNMLHDRLSPDAVVVWSDLIDSSEQTEQKLQGASLLAQGKEAEVLSLAQIAQIPGGCVIISSEQIKKLGDAIKTDFFIRYHIDKHLTGVPSANRKIAALITLSRSRDEKPFRNRDLEVFKALVSSANAALYGLKSLLLPSESKVPTSTDELLLGLEAMLPIAAALFDDEGRLLWLSREAETRFSVVSMRFGSQLVVTGQLDQLEAMRGLAQLVAQQPELSLREKELHFPTVLFPGERMVVRCFSEACRTNLLILVAITGGPEPPTGAIEPSELLEKNRCGLSAREADVACLAIQGYTVVNIAARLGVKDSTIRTYLKRIYAKLDVSSRAELGFRLLRQNSVS